MEPRLSLVTLGVADLARAAAFYRDGLGWPQAATGGDEVAFFHTGGAVLALYPRAHLAADAGLSPDAGGGFGGITLAHNVRERGEVDAVLAQAARAGAAILKPGHDAVWGGYTGYFADPDGHVWEVAWNPHFPMDAEGRLQLPA
jgi:catechol 2,3-dioxygenase-like lactoylglutathione lyase family enzyme